MKNKKVLIALIAIAIVGTIGGAFAYFTDRVEVANKFKTKPYGMQVIEEFVSPENWMPGDETPKTIIVNNNGEVEVAVRLSYTERWVSADNTVLSETQTISGQEVRAAIINLDNTSDWVKDGNYYYYNKKLASGESTTSFIKSVTFNSKIIGDTTCTIADNITTCTSTKNGYEGATYTLTINVETIQYNAYQAVWGDINIAKGYEVTFNSNEGSIVESQIIAEGGKATRPFNPVRDGYRFKEWQLNGEGFDFDNSVITADITLDAVWELNTATPIYSDGTINNSYFNIIKNGGEDSGVLNSNGINDAIVYAHENGINDIKLEKGNYYVSAENDYYTSTPSVIRKYAISAQSNINFNLNGSTITLVANSYPRYAIILIKGVSNFEITNGIIRGDRDFHRCGDGSLLKNNVNSRVTSCKNDALPTHEWGQAFQIYNSSDITISGLEITESTGDGLAISAVDNVNIINNNIHFARRNGISIISGKNITIENNDIHDIKSTDPQVGIDIEKDKFNQTYSHITIKNNRIYNTVNQAIRVFNKIYNLTIIDNELASNIFARVKPRSAIDSSGSDEFPTNADDEYLMEKYDIVIKDNTVMTSENIPSEHGTYNNNATLKGINTLNYKGYYPLKESEDIQGIKETNNATEYNLKKNGNKTIPVTWNPPVPTYKILSYESSNENVAKISEKGVITAEGEGTAIITVTATDYGKEPYDDSDNKTYSFEIKVNVTK